MSDRSAPLVRRHFKSIPGSDEALNWAQRDLGGIGPHGAVEQVEAPPAWSSKIVQPLSSPAAISPAVLDHEPDRALEMLGD